MQLQSELFTNLDSDAFAEALAAKESGALIDVRTPQEFARGHIPGAVNYDISDPSFPVEVRKLPREDEYYLYCRSGARSLTACQLMGVLGFFHLFNLKDGIVSWNGPLETADE